MEYNPGFGYITLTHFSGETRSVRIGTIDINRVEHSARYESKDGCHISTNDGFCQTGFTVKERPLEVLELIRKHDKEHEMSVRQYAHRNNFILLQGELW